MNVLHIPTLLLAAVAAPLVAQSRPQGLQPLPTTGEGFAAVSTEDGCIGCGDHYRARFGDDAVVFEPAFGPNEPSTRFLRLSLLGAGRGVDAAVAAPAPTRRDVDGTTVVYRRGDLHEVYEVRSEGLEQSFVFDRIPTGEGDLLVRCALGSDMPCTQASERRLVFAGINGVVEVGAVHCFDATGRRVTGTLSLADGVLTMRVPAAFVAAATAPLTVDPLVSSHLVVGGSSNFSPDVCHDAASNSWLMVWSNVLSSIDADVLAQRFDADGNLIAGGDLIVRGGTTWMSTSPRLCHVRKNGAFVVTWLDGWYNSISSKFVRARIVLGDGSAQGPVFEVSAYQGGDQISHLAIGGNRTTYNNSVAIGWTNNATIEGVGIRINTNNILSLWGQVRDIGFVQHEDNLSISDYEPLLDAFLIAHDIYTYSNQQQPGDNRSIYITIRDVYMDNLVGPGQVIPVQIPAQGADEINVQPSITNVDGFWAVAWRKISNPGTGVEHDEICGSTLVASTQTGALYTAADNVRLASEPNASVWLPQIAWGNGSVMLAYMTDAASPGGSDIFVRTYSFDHGTGPLNMFSNCENGAPCTSSGDVDSMRIASRTTSGATTPANERVMIAHHRQTTSDVVRRRVYEMQDGIAVNIGGGCGVTGDVHGFFNCARVGSGLPRLSFYNAPPGQAAWLVIGMDRLDMTCNGCTLVVDPWSAYIEMVTADGNGECVRPVTLPDDSSLRGMTFYQQWLMEPWPTAGCSAFGSLETSDCLRVTIQ